MKRFLLFTFIFVIILIGQSHAQKVTSEEEGMIRDAIQKMLKVSAIRIDSPAVRKVFAGTFYDVKLAREDEHGGSYGMGQLKLANVGNMFFEIKGTITSQAMPVLKRAIRKDFKLKTQEDAEILQKALDSIYKITSSSDKKEKAIINKGGEWIFVRGKFFKKKKGFIFKVNDGKITEVNYSLGIVIDE